MAALDNRDIDARQRQFARQHQSGWTAPSDQHRMMQSVSRHRYPHSGHSRFRWLGPRFYGKNGVLKQVPRAPYVCSGRAMVPSFDERVEDAEASPVERHGMQRSCKIPASLSSAI